MLRGFVAGTAVLATLLAAGLPAAEAALPAFADATGEAGIDFLHAGDPAAIYAEIMGSGACWFDYNADDWPDLFLVNGQYSNQTQQVAYDPRSKLYRNNGDGTFTDVTGGAGLSLQAWGQGCAAGDYDNDRDPDLYVTAYGFQYLFRNEGNGTFTNVTGEANVSRALCADVPCFSESAAWIDHDLDGDLDLYVLNNVAWDLRVGGPASPNLYEKQCNLFFRNNGDGTFTEAAEQVGVLDCDGASLAVATGDYDNDGWQDIFVASDETPDDLYRNNANGTFTDVAGALGVADRRGGMGVDLEDFNHDNLSDITITHFRHERYALYRSKPDGSYEDIAATHGLDSTRHILGWGAEFLDIDNDGFLDIAYANGHISANFTAGTSAEYDQRNSVYRGLPNGTFQDVTEQLGSAFQLKRVTRGLAVADYDLDGFLDLAWVNNPNQSAELWRSERGAGNFLTLRLRGNGTGVNTDAYGAKVWVEAGAKVWLREVGQSSYLSQHSLDVHFGLGDLTRVDKVSVRWPSDPAVWDNFTGLDANRILKLAQGGSLEVLRAFPAAAANASRLVLERNQTIALAGSAPLAPRPIVAQRWDWGDGNVTAGANATHAYASAGSFTAKFRATDDAGRWAEAHVEVRVVGAFPVADAGPDVTGDRASPVVFNGSASMDPNGEVVNYTWAFGEGSVGYGQVASHTYGALGNYTASLVVTDDEGATARDTALVSVVNLPPVAEAGPDRGGRFNKTFTFDGSASTDRDGAIVAWEWDFGDGSNASGAVVQHSFAEAGNYTVSLVVRDSDGATAADRFLLTATLHNAAPVARAGTDLVADRLTDARLDGSGSWDPDGAAVNFTWDLGDGTTAYGPVVRHRYAAIGAFEVTLKVTDDEGATGSDALVVTVVNLPPVALPGPPRDVEGLGPVGFEGSASYDPDGAVARHAWDFGDGSIAEGAVQEHTYAAYGRYRPALTVTDNDGASANASTALWLYAKPVAVVGPEGDRTGNRAEAQVFNGSASSDADGTVVAWAWDFGEGSSASGALAQHRYPLLGDFTATLTVTDNDGWTNTTRVRVRIVNLPPLVRVDGFSLANLHQAIALDSTGSYDRDGRIAARDWWLGDRASSAFVVYPSWTQTGKVLVVLTVTDNDGASATAWHEVSVVDWLRVAVRMDKDEFTVLERPAGRLEVRYANGLPVPGAAVDVAVAYKVRDPLATGLVGELEGWRGSVNGTTSTAGRMAFESPNATSALLGLEAGPSVAVPTVGHAVPFGAHHGSYDVLAEAAWRGNSGGASTVYSVRLLQSLDVG